jgi:hypothetical protein
MMKPRIAFGIVTRPALAIGPQNVVAPMPGLLNLQQSPPIMADRQGRERDVEEKNRELDTGTMAPTFHRTQRGARRGQQRAPGELL